MCNLLWKLGSEKNLSNQTTKDDMRKPDYISPTALKLYRDNRDEYYLRYLADTKSPRDGQTQPMSIGSAFDAYVKSDIHTKLFGAAATKEANTISRTSSSSKSKRRTGSGRGFTASMSLTCTNRREHLLTLCSN